MDVSLAAEPLHCVVAGVHAGVFHALPQRSQVGKPRTFATTDVENALQRPAQKIFGRRDRERDLAPYFAGVVNAMRAAAIPLVEVSAVVAFRDFRSASD